MRPHLKNIQESNRTSNLQKSLDTDLSDDELDENDPLSKFR